MDGSPDVEKAGRAATAAGRWHRDRGAADLPTRLTAVSAGPSWAITPKATPAFRQDCRDIDAWIARILLNRVDRLQDLSVMVVDHNRWSRLYVTDSLQQLGVSVVEASNGGSALRRALVDVPHAVIVASGLPELDAPELMHALHEDPRTRHTATVALQDIPDCDADLTLPCTPLDALASIVSALEVRRQALTVVPMRA